MNRTLLSLSLASNYIEDRGVIKLGEVSQYYLFVDKNYSSLTPRPPLNIFNVPNFYNLTDEVLSGVYRSAGGCLGISSVEGTAFTMDILDLLFICVVMCP